MKRIFTLMLALVMVLALSVTAFAEEKYTITINNPEPGHTYQAYQIFAGDLEMVDGNTVLTNITWRNGVISANVQATFKDAAAQAATLTTELKARDFAAFLMREYVLRKALDHELSGLFIEHAVRKGHLCLGQGPGTRLYADDIIKASRRDILGSDFRNREDIAIFHHIAQRDTILAQIFHAARLEPADIIGMMHDGHRIRIIKIHLMFRNDWQGHPSP